MKSVARCTALQSLCLRSCLLKKIRGIADLTGLVAVELYDNKIKRLGSGFRRLVNLETLDVSFNRIRVRGGRGVVCGWVGGWVRGGW